MLVRMSSRSVSLLLEVTSKHWLSAFKMPSSLLSRQITLNFIHVLCWKTNSHAALLCHSPPDGVSLQPVARRMAHLGTVYPRPATGEYLQPAAGQIACTGTSVRTKAYPGQAAKRIKWILSDLHLRLTQVPLLDPDRECP